VPARRALVFLLFFASGFAGLVYQVLWMRELGRLFGNGAQAVATTLAAFFLGVAAGSHVVVRNPFELEALPRPVLERAAELAAWHSKARGARGKVEVHVCRVADVRKPKGFAPGQVQLKRWDAVKVYPKGLDEPAGD